MSGLSRTPGKRVWANPHRGFESRPPLQAFMKNGPLRPVLHFYLPLYLPSGNAYRRPCPPLPPYSAVECAGSIHPRLSTT
jgi:hypothetical protein